MRAIGGGDELHQFAVLTSHSAASPVSGRAAGLAESLQFHVDGCTAGATTQTPGSAGPGSGAQAMLAPFQIKLNEARNFLMGITLMIFDRS